MEGINEDIKKDLTDLDINLETVLPEIDTKNSRQLFEMYKRVDARKYETESIESKFRPILNELRSAINNHEFTCIIGDDKSARIPALTMGRTINKIYTSRGEDEVPVLFIDPHNYTGAMGGDRGQGKKSYERHLLLKEKVKELFHNAGVEKGKVLLVTDYVSTGSTIMSFEDMVKEIGCEIQIIKDPFWHGRKDGGLSTNQMRDSLHARPTFIRIETPKDVIEQLDRLDRDCFDYENFHQLRHILLEIRFKHDQTFPIKSIEEVMHTGGGLNKIKFRSFILDDLTFNQQKLFLKLFRKLLIVEPRERAIRASEKLTEWYITPDSN